MSDEMKPFERLLKSQPLRQAPAEWREQILSAAVETQQRPQPVAGRSYRSIFYERLTSLLWPHPAAWGGLAAIWIAIFAVNFSIRDEGPAIAEKAISPSPEVVAQLKQQQHMLAELLGAYDSLDADRPKTFVPRPRSECTEILSA